MNLDRLFQIMNSKKYAFQTSLAALSLVFGTPALLAQDFDQLSLVQITAGLSQPVAVVHAGDDSHRLFIVEQQGVIRVLKPGSATVNATAFLDISSAVDNTNNEQGLLGLAFHPDYDSNGYFYVNYTRDPGGSGDDLTVVARYQVSEGDPDVADSTEFKLLEVEQDWSNHNGGDLHFGPDGYLFISLGDGGQGNDAFDNGQNIHTLKGAILRIDVDGAAAQGDVYCGLIQNYGIPAGNPFTDDAGCDEIWSYGLRNPWRFSFDRATGDMFIGDVGQNKWEEVNFEPANTPGVNYGWSCREGRHEFTLGHPCVSDYTDPILEYPHDPACSITGGYVYRGKVATFNGYYFYADYCSSQIWLAKNTGFGWTASEWPVTGNSPGRISSFGEDEDGELYIADRSGGKVFRIQIRQEQVFSDSFENLP